MQANTIIILLLWLLNVHKNNKAVFERFVSELIQYTQDLTCQIMGVNG